MPGTDEIQIEILEDGSIRALTDPVSGPNHMSADRFLQWIGEQAGGKVTRQRRGSHSHTHPQHQNERVKA